MATDVNANVYSSMYCPACGAGNPAQATHCFACHEPFSNSIGGSGPATNPLTGPLLSAVTIQQRYRILEVLSTDEVSTVYKAEDIQLGNRIVTLKEIGQNNAGTQETLERIEASRREMLLLAGLIHPNLPRVYDYFVENQRWYFVMDFLAGETLAAYMSKRKYRPLSVEEVLDSAIQLATVLDYLHLHQPPLAFKDLSLHTIWRTPDGKLYLLDVGVTLLTAAMPGNKSIYSLGKVLRQLQAGQLSVRSRLRFLPWLYKQFSHPQSLPLKLLIRQMLHKDVRKRLYIMGMVKQELQLLAAQQTTPSTLKKRRFPRRTLFKIGKFAGLAAVSSLLTWQAELFIQSGWPHPDYSSNLGGTIYTYEPHSLDPTAHSGVLAVAWSPHGTRLAMGDWNAQVQAWDANTGQHATSFYTPGLRQRVETLIWLPDGHTLAAAGDDGVVWLWNATTGEIRRSYRGHTNWVITIACSPDGKYMASGSNDQTVQVWEVATARPIVIYSGHSAGIGSVAWSPDGRYIASASFDMTVQIWEAATGRWVFTYIGHSDGVYTVAWSPDGQYIASGGKDHTVQVWPVALFERNGQQQKSSGFTYYGHTSSVQAVAWSPDSRNIASAGDNVQLWNGLTGEHIFTYTKHATGVQAIAWSPNGRYIASGGVEGTVQVWNAR